MVVYKDLHKKVEDLFNKDWAHESRGEVENNWKSGALSFKNKFVQSGSWATPSLHSLSNGELLFGGPAPVASSEIVYETPEVAATFKFGSEGKVNDEFKFKNVAGSGVSLINKIAYSPKTAIAYEAQAEYQANNQHWVFSAIPLKSAVSISSVIKVVPDVTVGGEIAATVPGNSFKYSLGTSWAIPAQSTVLGAKLVGESKGALAVTGFVHLSQGKTESAVQISSNNTGSLPSVTFVTKQRIDKDLTLKASVNDSLLIKAGLSWKISPMAVASLGVAYNHGTKADSTKFGLKVVFA